MLTEKEITRISKLLSLVLRHNPAYLGIELDTNGWTDVEMLLQEINVSGITPDRDSLNYSVETNPKKRFAFNDSLTDHVPPEYLRLKEPE